MPKKLTGNQNGFPDTNGYHDYSQFSRFDAQPFVPQPPPQTQQHQPSPPNVKLRPSVTHASSAENGLSNSSDFTSGLATTMDFEQPEMNGNISSSEEKDNLTPAQSRRKAQNRAA